jgi:hypothetical protein
LAAIRLWFIMRLAAKAPCRCRPVSSTLDRRARCHASAPATSNQGAQMQRPFGFLSAGSCVSWRRATGEVAAFELAPSPALLNEHAPGLCHQAFCSTRALRTATMRRAVSQWLRRREVAQESHRCSRHLQLGCLPSWKAHATNRCASPNLSRLRYLSLGRGGSTRQSCPSSPHTAAV